MICRTIAGQYVDITNPAILALVDDLFLAPGKRALFFCERWKIEMERQRVEQKKRVREMYLRNRPRSRYMYDELFKQFDLPL